MTDMRKKWTKEQIEASRRKYLAHRSHPANEKGVYVVELDREFASRAEVARYFKVSDTTIANAIRAGGAFGDYTLKDLS